MTQHPICDACETVAHCAKHGCIPITREDRRLRPVDWAEVVRDLERARLTTRRIGEIVGTSHSTVVKWKNDGVEPGHHTGERVLMLWAAVTGRTRDSAYLVPTFTSIPGKFLAHAEPQVTTCDSSQTGDEG